MPGRIAFVQLEPAIAAALRPGADGGCEVFDMPEQLLERLEQPDGALDAVVLGPQVREPLWLAQRVRALDRDLAVLIVSAPAQRDAVGQALRFAAVAGEAVRLRASDELDALPEALRDAVATTRARRRHRATLAAVTSATRPPPARPHAEVYLDRLLDHAPMGVALLDALGRPLSFNRRFAGLFEGHAAPSPTTPLSSLLPEPARGQLTTLVGRATGTHETLATDVVDLPGPGGLRHLEVTGAPLADPAGAPAALLFVQDVTERVQAERQRDEATRGLQRRIEELQAVYYLTAALARATSVEEVYTTALRSLQRAVQVERAAVREYDEDGVLRFKAWLDLSETYRRAVEPYAPWSGDARAPAALVIADVERAAMREDRREAMLREGIRALVCVPLMLRGTVVGTFTLYEPAPRTFDAHELQLAQTIANHMVFAIEHVRAEQERAAGLERERAARTEAENAVRVRDEFLSIAAHELKTPLTSLQLQVQMLLAAARGSGLGSIAPARAGTMLDSLNRQTGRLGRLIENLLDVSRISAGRLQLEREPFDLVTVVREAAGRLAQQLASAGCTLTLNAPAPVSGTWDRMRIEQVATNLLSNALKYGPGKPVEVSVTEVDGRARLEVRDHGIGIAPENRARIFGRFERAVSARNYGGLGLGLYITRQIVEAHGGSIGVEDAPGGGSIFIVWLPR
jgi:PAS domain S-box-containing protein